MSKPTCLFSLPISISIFLKNAVILIFKWSKFLLLITCHLTIFQFSIQHRWRIFCRFSDACTSLPTTGPSLPDGKFSPSLRFTFHASAFRCFTNKLIFHLQGSGFVSCFEDFKRVRPRKCLPSRRKASPARPNRRRFGDSSWSSRSVLSPLPFFSKPNYNEYGLLIIYYLPANNLFPNIITQFYICYSFFVYCKGLVRSPITATLPQISSRLYVTWGILWSFPQVFF